VPQLPGWNDCVKEVHTLAREAFLLWRSHNSPRHGPMYNNMRSTRAQFKLALRQCKRDRTRRAADSLAKHLLSKDSKSFWKEVKQAQGCTSEHASYVGGASGMDNICDMWHEHFSGLLNSSKDTHMKQEVLEQLVHLTEDDSLDRLTPQEIHTAIKSLKRGKSAGSDQISNEHYVYCDSKINVLLSMVFNTMVMHSYLPESLMDTLIIPLVKDVKGDVTDKDNYRPIAITCISSKIIELVFLSRYNNLLETSSNQFGFKAHHSTDLCIFTLKEVINFYKCYSSNVYACFLDASKAFDRVNHWHLFSKLLKRGMPKLVVRFLMAWYTTQKYVVKWGSYLSMPFTVSNGVRQGGILSPILFNVFMDDLSRMLSKLNVGCYMNSVCFNHLLYADDSVLLAPSPSALQKLVNVCVNFARDSDMVYNLKKTVCMCFKWKSNHNVYIPEITLNGAALNWKGEQKYLGVILTESLADDSDMKRQMRAIYASGNTVIRRFKACSDNVKKQLFRSYCTGFYCAHLWNIFKLSSYKRVKVSYNNVFRHLLGVRGACSISSLFVLNDVDSFNVIIRKATTGFISRLFNSDNVLISTIVRSSYFLYGSKLHFRWLSIAFNSSQHL
jgi:hypothetical protein